MQIHHNLGGLPESGPGIHSHPKQKEFVVNPVPSTS